MTPAAELEHENMKQPITEWALDYGITPGIIIARLERGMSVADAITSPMTVGHQGQRLPIFSTLQKDKKSRKRSDQSAGCAPVRNRAKTYTHDGKSLTIVEWASLTGLRAATLAYRLRKGWSIADALSTPPMPERASAAQINDLKRRAKAVGITYQTIESRMRRGWTLEQALAYGPLKGRRGVPSNFADSKGTGAGSTAQETPNLSF